MKFREYNNPEEKDYDINSSLNSFQNSNTTLQNKYIYQLTDLIGMLEDVTEEELQEQYGISMNEYLRPTAETIAKVTQKLEDNQNVRHR